MSIIKFVAGDKAVVRTWEDMSRHYKPMPEGAGDSVCLVVEIVDIPSDIRNVFAPARVYKVFTSAMKETCGQEVTIAARHKDDGNYSILENSYRYTDQMLEMPKSKDPAKDLLDLAEKQPFKPLAPLLKSDFEKGPGEAKIKQMEALSKVPIRPKLSGIFHMSDDNPRALMDPSGSQVAYFGQGKEDIAKRICEFLNSQVTDKERMRFEAASRVLASFIASQGSIEGAVNSAINIADELMDQLKKTKHD